MSFEAYEDINDNKLVISWLNSQNGISTKTIEKLLEYFETPINIWDNLFEEKNNLKFLRSNILEELMKKKVNYKEKLIERLNNEKVSIITLLDEEYPIKLTNIINPPSILYCKGDIRCLNNLSIAIVGSRKATEYGKWCANKFSKELSNLGVTIISGLAYGIDTISHKSTLKNNGKTIGVIGSGINIVYPLKNRELYEEIEAKGSLIVTEYPFDREPIAANFPNRNRIISGLSSGILVIEAQDRSGTLITATHAAEQGKDVFAVPGNINSIFSVGTNKLIKDGAKLVMSVEDIIEEIRELRDINRDKAIRSIDYNSLNEVEKQIIALLEKGSMDIDSFCCNINNPTSEILSNLTILEMKDIVVQTSSKKFMLAN
ncbi:DNA-processing protein DprA [Sedimentibacter sp. zth1]|uniref:DNA-processing protein DprA n=1 Tax=Sedimentibacter sp. zth1 TaxID=2816908 RepID=UPI001A90EB4F|nr:DNA-processing protein DprA [Sedimentibacter sp. zth1]QSX06561.1 DNA-processing protein DprA [Sedimentibacter sp. zth1]